VSPRPAEGAGNQLLTAAETYDYRSLAFAKTARPSGICGKNLETRGVRMRLAVLLGALIAVSTSQVEAIRVQFPPGASSTKIKGTFGNESKVRYIVNAAAGQRIKVSLSTFGNYRFFVYAPKSDDPINGMGLSFQWSGVLPVTGDYVIQVFTDERERSDPFELEITLTTGAKTAHPAEAAGNNEFSPDGYYVFSGKAPTGFANFKGFSLTTSEARPDGKPVAIPPSGEIDAGGKYKMVNINVSGDALAFETKALRGTSYKFEGKFLVTKGWCDDGKTTGPVLSGHLIRLLNGLKVAEAGVKFEWSCSDI